MENEQEWSEVQILANIKSLSNKSSPRSSPVNLQSHSPKITSQQNKIIDQINHMELSIPFSEATKASYNNLTQQKDDMNLEQMNKKYQQTKKQFPSNLQALKNMHRIIQKNHKIKIQSKTEFPLVRNVAVNDFGWSCMSKQDHKELVDIIWTDTYVTEELVNRLRPYQKINHFPRSTQLGRKDYLFTNLNQMRQKFPQQFNFYAKTWIFPQDYSKFKSQTKQLGDEQKIFYIAKPVASCQGKGIHLGKRTDMLYHNSQNKLLIQEYIKNPLLIDGLKFDLRIYVLIKSLEPLQIYIYKQGLTRLATNKYQKPNDLNYKNGKMHLTNYAINKNNPDFIHNRDFRKDNIGHKRSLASVFDDIQRMGGNSGQIKQKINTIIVKAILAAYQKMILGNTVKNKKNQMMQDSIKNISIVNATQDGFFTNQAKYLKNNMQRSQNLPNHKSFQLLGFDIMITQNFQPKLIQINHQPSLTASSPLDYIIKKYLLIDVFNLLQMNSQQKQKYLNNQRQSQLQKINRCLEIKNMRIGNERLIQEMGGFNLICPCQNLQTLFMYQKIEPLSQLVNEEFYKLRRDEYSPLRNYQKEIREKSLRLNKTSLIKKRDFFICNYINMLTPEHMMGKKPQISASVRQSTKKLQKELVNNPQVQPLIPVQMPIIGDGQIPNQIKTTQKSNLLQLPISKKNVHFTIKYKKSSRNSKSNIPGDSKQFQQQQTPQTKIPAKMTLYNTKAIFQNMHLFNARTTQSNIHNHEAKSLQNTVRIRHTSHQNRIGIRVLKQENEELGKIQIRTKNLNNSSIKQRTISLQKNLNLIKENTKNLFNKNISDQIISHQHNPNFSLRNQQQISLLNKYRSIQQQEQQQQCSPTTSQINKRSLRKFLAVQKHIYNHSPKRQANNQNQLNDRIYQKQLMNRIQKMKNMKEKLQKIKKNYTKKQQEIEISKDQFRVKHINGVSATFSNKYATTQRFYNNSQKSKIKQQDHLPHSQIIPNPQKDNNPQKQSQPHQAFQTIKLMQFEQPNHKRKISHHSNYNNNDSIKKQKDSNYKLPNNSLQLFKDENFYKSGK